MTNNFMHGLIARHQESSNVAMQLVQPRPKSRFEDLHEPSSIEGNELIRNSGQELASVSAEDQNFFSLPRPSPFAEQPKVPPQQPILQRRQLHDVAGMPAESVHRDSRPPQRYFSEFTASPQPLQSALQRLNMQLPSASPNTEFSQQEPLFQKQPSEKISEPPTADRNIAEPHFSTNNLESSVQRLNIMPVSREHASPQHQKALAEQGNIADSKSSENKTVPELPASAESKKGQLTLTGELNQRIQEILRRSTMPQNGKVDSGLLQLPGWLNDMQTELHHRWQESGPPPSSAPEPVINVTIGRVEVRAAQTMTEQKTQRSTKPSGVMSLEDYLKRRENKG